MTRDTQACVYDYGRPNSSSLSLFPEGEWTGALPLIFWIFSQGSCSSSLTNTLLPSAFLHPITIHPHQHHGFGTVSELVSKCGPGSHFTNGQWHWALHICFLAVCVSLLFCSDHLSNIKLTSFFVVFSSILWQMNSWKIFSYSVGCLFTIQILWFLYKTLLIWYNLFPLFFLHKIIFLITWMANL